MFQARWDNSYGHQDSSIVITQSPNIRNNFSRYWEPKLCTEELDIWLLSWGWKKMVVCRRRMGDKNQIILSTSWHPKLLPWKGHRRRAIPHSTPKVIYKYGWKDSTSSLFGQRWGSFVLTNSNQQREDIATSVISCNILLQKYEWAFLELKGEKCTLIKLNKSSLKDPLSETAKQTACCLVTPEQKWKLLHLIYGSFTLHPGSNVPYIMVNQQIWYFWRSLVSCFHSFTHTFSGFSFTLGHVTQLRDLSPPSRNWTCTFGSERADS